MLKVQGGTTSSTLGVEVTSQSVSTQPASGNLPPLGTFMGTGFGGLSLVQTGGYQTSGAVGQASPMLSMCAQQFLSSTSTGYECWNWQVLGSGSSDILNLSLKKLSSTTNITLQVPPALNIAAGDSTTGLPGQLTISSVPTGTTNLSQIPITGSWRLYLKQ